MISPQPPADPRARPTLWKPLATALAFALTGCIFSSHNVATITLPHILAPDPSLAYQEVSDYLPVPRDLDWNLSLIQTMVWLREIRGSIMIWAAVLVAIALGWIFLNLVEAMPSFQRPVLRKAANTVPEAASDASVPSGSGLPPTARAAIGGVRLLPILLYAGSFVLLLAFGITSVSENLLRYYHTLGTFHQGYFQRLALASLASTAAIWAAGGLALYAVCAPRRSPTARLALVGVAAVLFGISYGAQRPLQFKILAAARDWSPSILTAAPPYSPTRPASGVPDGMDAGEEIANRLQLKLLNQPEQPERTLLLFYPDGVVNVKQEGYTEDGLTASEESAKQVRGFLERRHYETALSWTAVKHLFNVATVHFDTTTALQTCMLDMERCPHLAQCGMATREMLFTCAATPDNIAVLDQWADERLFAHPTRESLRLMGELYERFGVKDKALIWYRRADMPRSLMAKVQSERPLYHSGTVTGRLLLNGKPMTGVHVGVVPRRLNGLPPDLEPEVLRARADLTAFRRDNPLFQRFSPRPYAFRWISAAAVTDTDGRFTIENLTEGEYMFVCTLPPQIHLMPLKDPNLQVGKALPRIWLNYDSHTTDLGTIPISVKQ